ncbi:hypothetical protein DC522_03540 [Microvirga sp. KLBC 81]|uniref:hypothetical protein n=1 Tax=Microvirga sp. KLBC 81 TaxID=1862707 RepID=UPI000D518815|nr:hypothetical protein [Microvirga sp. KLBC 81]PVE25855.1 hypothetical protein DC522_03540 [Microvirga sp. KLBC 81]
MKTHPNRTREAKLWRDLDPAQTARIMAECYGEGAGAEVLLRAFLEERDMNPAAVRFWLRVYQGLKGEEDSGSSKVSQERKR